MEITASWRATYCKKNRSYTVCYRNKKQKLSLSVNYITFLRLTLRCAFFVLFCSAKTENIEICYRDANDERKHRGKNPLQLNFYKI